MDPFSSEGELVNIHTAFAQAQYTSVLDDYNSSDFAESNRLPVQILQYRAQCELGQCDEVLSSISNGDAQKTPDLAAVRALAKYLKNGSEDAVAEAEKLAETQADNLSVQLLCGTVLARAGKADQAVSLLSRHTGSLDAVALITQIQLQQNRTDLALQQAKSARSFAQDALLVNLAESWIGMRRGGEEYQKAFYVFEELAQAPSSQTATSLVAQAVAEMHMGRTEEADAALARALELEPESRAALANKVALDAMVGRDGEETRGKLEGVDKEHVLLADMMAKREAFQEACKKYSPKFS
ncbi:hypothetical protein B0A50_07964 [Salinomyces thailandicus]|uniref:Coatomer subunit epsilon n=1 Tax=Salinomyces thailandicus TaxID=706561 RepID=A0A4V5N368_9PEZI|nr:hypothetical protein B0A50_07964 [Salinomyces thailandica]